MSDIKTFRIGKKWQMHCSWTKKQKKKLHSRHEQCNKVKEEEKKKSNQENQKKKKKGTKKNHQVCLSAISRAILREKGKGKRKFRG